MAPTYKRLLSYVKPYWLMFSVAMIATVFSSGIDAGLAYLLKPLMDKGFIARDQAFLQIFPLLIIGIFLARGIAGFLSTCGLAAVARKVVMTFRQQLFTHMLKLPARYFDNRSSGELLSKLIYDVEQVAFASSDALLMLVRESCYVAGLLVVMFTVNWRLSALFLLSIPCITVIVKYASKRMRHLSHRLQVQMGAVTHVAEETIEGYRVVRIFGGEPYEQDKFYHATRENCRGDIKLVVTNAISSASVQMVAAMAMALIIFIVTLNISALNITAGGFASIVTAIVLMLKPMKNLTNVNANIQKGLAGAESVFAMLDELPEVDDGHRQLSRARGQLSFREVNFAYTETGHQVLHDINLDIAAGETVALVGRSGSGKSTLVSLIPRFYDCTQGQILLDGVPLNELQLADLRQQVALVSQQVTLFNDTVAHNIAYGRLADVSEEDIIAAAKAAHAYEFVKELPEGINTLVGENGVLLSGGQRQRLAIARAILKDAPILILDEATSALDTESERYIQAALEDLMRNRTTLVIAHRLSTIENADRIVVMEQGRIVETGNHQQLLTAGGAYARLYQLQFNQQQSTSAAMLADA